MTQETPTRPQPETSDMVVVHRVFRREFRLLPRMVRAVDPGDTARARIVAAHCTEMMDALHHHHSGEDDLIWPLLHRRATLQASVVARMEQQHEVLAALLEQAAAHTSTWATDPGPKQRDTLAEILEQVGTALGEHLNEEEQTILPLVREHLSVQEWAQLGERGMASMPRDRLVVFLAHMLEEATPQERTNFLRQVPLPGRLAHRLIGRRKHLHETQLLRRGL